MAPSRVRIPPSPLAQRPPRLCAHPRRGGRAVECGGLENRYPSLGGSRVQIPPPPLGVTGPRSDAGFRAISSSPCESEWEGGGGTSAARSAAVALGRGRGGAAERNSSIPRPDAAFLLKPV